MAKKEKVEQKNELVTVGRLIPFLMKLPKDTPIVLSQDSEGNGYSALTDFGIGGLMVKEGGINMPCISSTMCARIGASFSH